MTSAGQRCRAAIAGFAVAVTAAAVFYSVGGRADAGGRMVAAAAASVASPASASSTSASLAGPPWG
jgi:hypothetical protein